MSVNGGTSWQYHAKLIAEASLSTQGLGMPICYRHDKKSLYWAIVAPSIILNSKAASRGGGEGVDRVYLGYIGDDGKKKMETTI